MCGTLIEHRNLLACSMQELVQCIHACSILEELAHIHQSLPCFCLKKASVVYVVVVMKLMHVA